MTKAVKKTKSETKQVDEKVETKPKAPEEPSFFIHELREHSRRLFGVKPEVLDGALFDVSSNQMTKSEVERRVRAFLSREVKS